MASFPTWPQVPAASGPDPSVAAQFVGPAVHGLVRTSRRAAGGALANSPRIALPFHPSPPRETGGRHLIRDPWKLLSQIGAGRIGCGAGWKPPGCPPREPRRDGPGGFVRDLPGRSPFISGAAMAW